MTAHQLKLALAAFRERTLKDEDAFDRDVYAQLLAEWVRRHPETAVARESEESSAIRSVAPSLVSWLQRQRMAAEDALRRLGVKADGWRVLLDDVVVDWDGISTGFSREAAVKTLGGPELVDQRFTEHAEKWQWARIAKLADTGIVTPNQAENCAHAIRALLTEIDDLRKVLERRPVMVHRARQSATIRKTKSLRALVEKATTEGKFTRPSIVAHLRAQHGATVNEDAQTITIHDLDRKEYRLRSIDNELSRIRRRSGK